MNKRIIVGLDGSGFANTATKIACQHAQSSEGTVVGIGVVDLAGIESVERGAPIGSIHFAEKAEEHKLKDALEKVDRFLNSFEETCKKYGVKYELHSTEGVPFRAIVNSGKMADLIVVGLRTFYHFETSSKPGDTLQRVLQHSVCPVMAVPERMEKIRDVVIAYDGSMESAKAIRAFVLGFHPILKDLDLTLLTVSEKKREGESIQQDAQAYLRCWNAEPKTEIKSGKTDRVLLEYSTALDHPLLVMGAFGRSPISEFFFGATARRIIHDTTIPMMIYH